MWWYFIAGLLCGFIIAVVLIAILNAGKEADERMEKFIKNCEVLEVPRKEKT